MQQAAERVSELQGQNVALAEEAIEAAGRKAKAEQQEQAAKDRLTVSAREGVSVNI